MANEDKDRVPARTGAHTSRSGVGAEFGPGIGPKAVEGGSRPGVITVRLWSAAGKRLDCRWSRNNGALSGVVLDTIRASGGVTGAENPESVAASFVDVLTGLQCARRIQWAVEGLTEYEGFRGAAAAILVDAGESGRPLAAASAQDWEGVDPGKIVLHGGACEALDGVPGVELSTATATGWREWTWRPAGGNAGFAADEQALLGILRTAGRSDPAGGSASDEDPAGTPTRVFSSRAMATGATRQPKFAAEDTEKPGVGKLLKMPVVIGAVAAVLIAVAVIFFMTRKSTVQSAAPGTPAAGQETHPAQRTAPTEAAPAAAQNPPAHASTPNPPSKHTKLSEVLKKLTPGGDQKAAAPPVVASHCDLTDEDIQRSLARADRNMENGDLSDARAAYQHVQGCPSGRDRAQAGLERIRKMAALNGSPN